MTPRTKKLTNKPRTPKAPVIDLMPTVNSLRKQLMNNQAREQAVRDEIALRKWCVEQALRVPVNNYVGWKTRMLRLFSWDFGAALVHDPAVITAANAIHTYITQSRDRGGVSGYKEDPKRWSGYDTLQLSEQDVVTNVPRNPTIPFTNT